MHSYSDLGYSELDDSLRNAYLIAEQQGILARGRTGTNPAVGAVIIAPNGEIIGQGHTQHQGGHHAEVMSIKSAQNSGRSVRGATAVVTLEPCSHKGLTPACTELLLQEGISRVVFGWADPSPLAHGGAQYLQEHGVEVIGPLFSEKHPPTGFLSSVEPWLRSLQKQRPAITLKYASSLDGRIAAADGSSQWITSEQARAWSHFKRSQYGAIVVGTGTVRADHPTLSARYSPRLEEIFPNICHPGFQLNTPDSNYLRTAEHTGEFLHQPDKVVLGNSVLTPRDTSNLGHFIRVKNLDELQKLLSKDITDILVEGGSTLASSLLEADLVDFIEHYQAPIILGAGKALVDLPSHQSIADKIELTPAGSMQLGPDILAQYRVNHNTIESTYSVPKSED